MKCLWSWRWRGLLSALLLCLLALPGHAAISVVGSSFVQGISSPQSSVALSNPGTQLGDVLLAQVALGVGNATITAPAGWVAIRSDVGDAVTQRLFYRITDASEPSSYTFSFGNARVTAGLLVLRGVKTSGSSPALLAAGSSGAGNELIAPSVSGATAGSLVVRYFALGNGNNSLIPPTMQRYNLLSGAGPNGVASSASTTFRTAPGATGTATATVSGTAGWVAATLVLEPAVQSVALHYRLSFSTPALSCKPIPVTVTSCTDSSCSATVATNDSIALTPVGAWIGGDIKSFAGSSSLTAYLKREAVTRVLGVSAASYDCSPANCTLEVKDSGFVFSNLTPMIAGKPQPAIIQAVRKDDATQNCAPAFTGGARTLQFSATYITPGIGSMKPSVAGVALTPGSNGGHGATENVTLVFDNEARAAVELVYADAGKVGLKASYSGAANSGNPGASEEFLSMGGGEGFVSRPYGLCLQTAALQSNDYSATSSLFPGGVRAGDSFDLTIKPVIWTPASEAAPPLQAANICGNPTTPNYQQSGIPLEVEELNGGHAGVLGIASHAHPLGGAAVVEQSISEVGVFRLTAKPPSYLDSGASPAISQSGRVGRFIPAYFKVAGSASLKPSCGHAFSYQGQPMAFAEGLQPSLTVTAYSRFHTETRNYDRPGFWKLGDPAVGSYVSVTAELLDPADPNHASTVERDVRLASQGAPDLAVTGADDVDGARTYTWSGQELLYAQPLVPGSADYPFRARIRQEFSASSLTDPEGVCHGDGSSCQPYGYVFADSPGSEVRLGRLRVGNAHGSELQDLSLPLLLESWRDTAGGSFQVESMDTCTVLGAASLDAFTDNLALNETTPTISEPFVGVGSLLLSAPGAGNDGSVRASFPALPLWLQYPWDGLNRQGASGLATFGIYKGSAPLIFRCELYR